METHELWHRGPWPQKTTQTEAYKREAVLTSFLPSLSPSCPITLSPKRLEARVGLTQPFPSV